MQPDLHNVTESAQRASGITSRGALPAAAKRPHLRGSLCLQRDVPRRLGRSGETAEGRHRSARELRIGRGSLR